ncbi:rod shape-determining protein MreD [Planktothricoides sp. SR001]|uniref:rod shape-determining protein MreD n=1 Tax=Planktothricoides sp. SR001 TaxID=1705388 RepID=UPI0006C16E18|nr:rod shape-determining protein MreD [Planktothricoides sp. SR001]KOR36743.1 rod shape-determining protein MreD [Planktothricoides sp. SR001]
MKRSLKISWLDWVSYLPTEQRTMLNTGVTIASVFLCLFLLPTRLPGMELLHIAPDWLLIWMVTWSIQRTPTQACFMGVILGLLQDGMTAPWPTHALSLALVGLLSSYLQKQRLILDDFVSVALVVFGMAIVAETVLALQFGIIGDRPLNDIWIDHQRIALASAILSSLWAPAIYLPLSHWWKLINPNN